jgi:hypothetical protein
MIICGKSFSGKSNVILNMMDFMKKPFKNRLLVLCATLDGSITKLQDTHGAVVMTDIYDDKGNNVIRKLLDHQRARKEAGLKMKHYCIIADDLITNASFMKKNSIWNELFSQARHYYISVIVSTQSWKLLPAPVRRMSMYQIIFRITNANERKAIFDELSNSINVSEDEFQVIFDHCTTNKFDFIYIDAKNNEWSHRFEGKI